MRLRSCQARRREEVKDVEWEECNDPGRDMAGLHQAELKEEMKN